MPKPGTISQAQVHAAVKRSPRAKPAATHTATAFCAQCQADGEHEVYVDHNQEMVITCKDCQRMWKIPLSAVETPEDLAALLARHKESNVGQIAVELVEEEQAVFDAKFKKLMGIKD